MRHGRPQADGRRCPAVLQCVVHDADDARRPFVARRLEAELGRRAQGRWRPPVTGAGRVCGTSARSEPKRDEQLDAEVLREREHEAGERPPAEVRLDPEQDDRVAVGAGDGRVEEGVLGPVDLARLAVDERHVRPRRLEVEEALRLDLCEPRGIPLLREVRGCRATRPGRRRSIRGRLRSAPAAAAAAGTRRSALTFPESSATGRQSRATIPTVQPKSAAATATCSTTTHHGTVAYVRYCSSPTPIWARSTTSRPAHARTSHGYSRRFTHAQPARTRKTIPKAATARTCSQTAGWNVPRRGTTFVPELPGNRPAAVESVPVTTRTATATSSTAPPARGSCGSAGAPPRTSRDASSSASTATPSTTSDSSRCEMTRYGLRS